MELILDVWLSRGWLQELSFLAGRNSVTSFPRRLVSSTSLSQRNMKQQNWHFVLRIKVFDLPCLKLSRQETLTCTWPCEALAGHLRWITSGISWRWRSPRWRTGLAACAAPSRGRCLSSRTAWTGQGTERRVADSKGPLHYAAWPLGAGNPSAGSACAAGIICADGRRPHHQQARRLP